MPIYCTFTFNQMDTQPGVKRSQKFIGVKLTRKLATHLMFIKQGKSEPLGDYTRRFIEEVLMVEDNTK